MRKALLLGSLALVACDRDEPPAPSAEQTERLNEAEDMLNDFAANEEGPADSSTGPSNTSN